MNTTTYKESEDILKANGFIYECGMPLCGMRFKSSTQYAFLFRKGNFNYETIYYDIIAEA